MHFYLRQQREEILEEKYNMEEDVQDFWFISFGGAAMTWQNKMNPLHVNVGPHGNLLVT